VTTGLFDYNRNACEDGSMTMMCDGRDVKWHYVDGDDGSYKMMGT